MANAEGLGDLKAKVSPPLGLGIGRCASLHIQLSLSLSLSLALQQMALLLYSSALWGCINDYGANTH